MMRNLWLVYTLVVYLLDQCVVSAEASPDAKRPNFVILLVDDLGIGDIGCFGNDTIKTPNIDKLASRGAKLNHNLAPESMCTPSRAATLTGRYAVRSGMASGPGETRVFLNIGTSGGLPSNETTIAEVLQESGYKTGLIGKWHLGLNCNDSKDGCHHPMNMGFHEFYGLPMTNIRAACGSKEDGSILTKYLWRLVKRLMMGSIIFWLALMWIGFLSQKSAFIFLICSMVLFSLPWLFGNFLFSQFNCVLMRGNEVVEQPIILENLTVRFTDEAKRFVHKHRDEPFFLFMSYVKVHTSLFTSPRFKGHSVHGRYGDNVEEMDWSVGEIISSLESENILDNTFVYFTSDHGPFLEEIVDSGEYCGGWKGPYRGGKGQSWEGGIRVPTIAMWKDHIAEGITVNEATNTMDIFTTMANIVGQDTPTDRIIDSKNILPLLTQEEVVSPHQFMYHYCGNSIHAVRYRPPTGNVTWKAHFTTPNWAPGKEECPHTFTTCLCFGKYVTHQDPPLLYDITNDPYERHQLDTTLEEYYNVISKMKEAMKKHTQGIKPVPKQLGYPNAWWNPHRQPCCNFPYCSCVES